LASLGVLPRQVSASGVSLVDANYRHWEPAYNVEIDFEGLATAVKLDEEQPNASWFGETQVAEQGSQPDNSSQGGSGDAGAPSQEPSSQTTTEAQLSPSDTLQPSNTAAASATSRQPTRRPTLRPSNTPVPPTLTRLRFLQIRVPPPPPTIRTVMRHHCRRRPIRRPFDTVTDSDEYTDEYGYQYSRLIPQRIHLGAPAC
jgi:hypothetical protein